MSRGKPGELTEFARPLRRQVRRRAFHNQEAERLRVFANYRVFASYLDADAVTLEAKPTSSHTAKVRARLPEDDAQTLTPAERALVARLNRKLRLDLMALRRAPQNGQDAPRSGDYRVAHRRLHIVHDTHVDPADFGRTLDCLKPWERLVGE